MRSHRLLLALALLALAVGVVPAATPTMTVDELRPGMRALVHTVFHGDSIETFEAEIVEVVRGGVDGDMVLARGLGERVERVGVAQGMSGSPVTIDGRLVGALSSGWAFSREPVFGITPIAEMLKVLDLPDLPGDGATSGPSGVAPASLARWREFRWAGEEEGDSPVTPPPARAARALTLPLMASGLAPGAQATVEGWWSPLGLDVVPAGIPARSGADAPTRALRPGSAVAVDLMRGDLSMSAIGTVTWTEGDRVLLFGHPFFQSGAVRLPLSTARIATVLGSLNLSFKLGTSGTPVGTVTQDRRPAVAARLGVAPRLLPVSVTVEGSGMRARRFRFETVEDRALLPQLLATAVLNSALESGGMAAMQTVDWSMSVWRGGSALTLGDRAGGEQPLSEVALAVASPVRFLAGNPFATFRADSVTVSLVSRPGRSQATIRSLELLTPVVRPGGEARVRVTLERWRGGTEIRTLTLPVPAELLDGRYTVRVAGGLEADRDAASRIPTRFRAVSLDDAWRRLASARRTDHLYASLWGKSPEVSLDGEDLVELPASAVPLIASSQRAGERVRRAEWALVSESDVAQPFLVRGEATLQMTVDRSAPE